jgi:SRSO17 transposase
MTDEEITKLGPAFANYLKGYKDCFLQKRTATHFNNYCRGLLSDLPRKSVEPIALASGTAVRTLQEFLITADWDHPRAHEKVQRRLIRVVEDLPADPLGTIGVIDETSSLKKGDKTPGVQRQYLGCVGKIDNGIVTVHLGVAKGAFQALLDAELYLPKSWGDDRKRCREAGIPDSVRYRSKWRIAYEQLVRLEKRGLRFDWLVFDEGYGSKVPLLRALDAVNQRFVGEVPVNFSVRTGTRARARRADAVLRAADAKRGTRVRVEHRTIGPSYWRAAQTQVRVGGCTWRLVAALNEATGELKYFVTNAPVGVSLTRVLAVAFRRATIEHSFRLAKSEAGLLHFEGRRWLGLVRHLILNLVVLGFVSIHTDRLRGEKSTGDDGAGVPGAEHDRGSDVPAQAQARRTGSEGLRDPIPPAPQPAGRQVPQKAAA